MAVARTSSVSVEKPWREVYEAIWRPEVFPEWATGLSKSELTKEGDRWKAEGPGGTVVIRFTGHNDFGVMDHHVETGKGPEIYVPLRVIENGDGAEVLLTLFRQLDMSDDQFEADGKLVEKDLESLRKFLSRS